MPDPTPPSSPASSEPWVEITSDCRFADFLAEQQVSLAVFERTFDRCMGLWADGQTLWMSTRYQLWRFENTLRPGELYQGHDRLYVPRVGYTTGDLDIHD